MGPESTRAQQILEYFRIIPHKYIQIRNYPGSKFATNIFRYSITRYKLIEFIQIFIRQTYLLPNIFGYSFH